MTEEEFKLQMLASVARLEERLNSLHALIDVHIRSEESMLVRIHDMEMNNVTKNSLFTIALIIATMFAGIGAAIAKLWH